jgi:hypothetical protein
MPRLVVTFDDGIVKTVSTARPSVMLAMEQRFDGRQNPEGIWEICWLAYRGIMGVVPPEGPDFDAWIDTIAELDFEVDEEAVERMKQAVAITTSGTVQGNGDASPPPQPAQFIVAPSPGS